MISVSGVARIELKGNTIHDGSGTLRAAQLANVSCSTFRAQFSEACHAVCGGYLGYVI